MKMKNGMYLFAAAIVASTVGLSSCSNDEEGVANPYEGKTTTVSVGVSVKTPTAKRAALTDANVNLGDEVADIANVTIVPFIDETGQTPILLGTVVSDDNKKKSETATIQQTVNSFRVYGNVTGIDNTQPFKDFDITPGASDNEDRNDGLYQELKAPYGLYYYANTLKTGYYAVNNNADWAAVSNWGALISNKAIANNNRIKIEDVKYAVGVLASKVLVDLEKKDEKCFGSEVDGVFTGEKTYQEVLNENNNKAMTLKGLVIYDQPASVNTKDFTWNTNKVKVFAAATSSNLTDGKLDFGASWNGQMKGANIYSVVAPETNKITVVYQFLNETGYTLQLNDGTFCGAGKYAYYMTELSADGTKGYVFAAGVTTLLNATVKDWGKGTLNMPENTDVQIGVEIDVTWAEGVIYNQDI